MAHDTKTHMALFVLHGLRDQMCADILAGMSSAFRQTTTSSHRGLPLFGAVQQILIWLGAQWHLIGSLSHEGILEASRNPQWQT